MFYLDDDDVTDLVPDSEAEKKEKKRFHKQEQRQRRMTVSEVCMWGIYMYQKLFIILIFQRFGMNLSVIMLWNFDSKNN